MQISRHEALPVFNDAVISWLVGKGVPAAALIDQADLCNPLRMVKGAIAADGYLEQFDSGALHIACGVYDDSGELADIAVWQPRGDKVGSFEGRALAFGQEQISNPGTYTFNKGLMVHRTALGWLQHGREGIVIIRPEAAFSALRNASRLVAEDRHHGQELKRLIQPRICPKSSSANL